MEIDSQASRADLAATDADSVRAISAMIPRETALALLPVEPKLNYFRYYDAVFLSR